MTSDRVLHTTTAESFVFSCLEQLGEQVRALDADQLDAFRQMLMDIFQAAGGIRELTLEEIFANFRRQAFVEQVRRAIGPKLSELSQRQKDLLDASLTSLFKKGRLVSDEEIEGRLELITDFVSPRSHEIVQEYYWSLRRARAELEEEASSANKH